MNNRCFAGILITLPLIVLESSVAFANQKAPPSSVKNLYSKKINWEVSSNFENIDFEKFTYRNRDRTQGNAKNTFIKKKNKEAYLTVQGKKGTRNGGGLTTINESFYGFYIVRWKIDGLIKKKPSAWHPSIWSSWTNQGVVPRKLSDTANTIDINWMEVWHYPTWNYTIIDKENGKRVNISKADIGNEKYFEGNGSGEWKNWGLEYHPSYIQTWEYEKLPGASKATWNKRKKIFFSNITNNTKVRKVARSPLYWLFSNKYHYDPGSGDTVTMYIDYFYHFPLK